MSAEWAEKTWRELLASLEAYARTSAVVPESGAPRRDLTEEEAEAWSEAHARLERYGAQLVRRGFVNADVEDAVNTLTLQILDARLHEQVAKHGSIGPGYFMVALRNQLIDSIRRRRPLAERAVELAREKEERNLRTDPGEQTVESLRLRAAISQLYVDEQDLLRAHFFEGLTIREMADQAKVHYSAMAKRLSRSVEKLRQILAASERR